ncbi:MAG: excinuclease ABC subunit UvrA, partial [Bacteroidales bacterium]
KSTNRNPRSTVGTITEIYDFLRLLYARASTAYSPVTGEQMVSYTPKEIVDSIVQEFSGQKAIVMAPLVKGRKGHYKELFETLLKRGFNWVRVDGVLCDLSTIEPLSRYSSHFIELVIDKIVPSAQEERRVLDSVNLALQQGKGSLDLLLTQGEERVVHYSKDLMCPVSGLSLPEPAPHSFSFNSPQGACPKCKGLGILMKADLEKIIPNSSLSIAKGGIKPIGEMRDTLLFRQIEGIAKKYNFSLHDPIEELPEEALNLILYGSDELIRISGNHSAGKYSSHMVTFDGIVSLIEKRDEEENLKHRSRHFTEEVVCDVCNGTRLKKEALNFKVDGKRIAELSAMEVSKLYSWMEGLEGRLERKKALIARELLKELRERLGFLLQVGLEYLSLDRATATLSGGESQRIRLATQIGSKLVNVLYILDEPSIGLHYRDNRKLIESLKRLRDEGNSIMVVEHDSETITSADHIIELGRGAGDKGGELIFSGSPKEVFELSSKELSKIGSYTLDWLRGVRGMESNSEKRVGNGHFLTLKGATGNNLKGVDLSIPLGCFVGVAGVSGSGKSSLINETLVPALNKILYRSLDSPLPYKSIEGVEYIDKLIEVDQSPIGRTPRSNPATYTNLFSDIRKLFGETPDAKIRGFKAGRFSFNTKGGRCEECKGAGVKVVEMNFLPSVNIECNLCHGKRYNPETLAVKYGGRNIFQVLDMTVSQALKFFSSIPSICRKLKTLEEVGLGYIKLGQSSTTLSGGESQRVKLAKELSKNSTGKSLFILDEPTTGLHFEDVKVLLGVLQRLVDKGNSVVVIEHNLDVLRAADIIVDMGPQGGEGGGRIVAVGSPQALRDMKGSVTGPYI